MMKRWLVQESQVACEPKEMLDGRMAEVAAEPLHEISGEIMMQSTFRKDEMRGFSKNHLLICFILSILSAQAPLSTYAFMMTKKILLPFLTTGLLFFAACNPEKPVETEEVLASKADASLELKLAAGKAVYESSCAGCHDSGVAGAPKPGDKIAWNERLKPGVDVLVKKSIDGFEGKLGVMPPKGGNAMLTDEETGNAVAYMVDRSK